MTVWEAFEMAGHPVSNKAGRISMTRGGWSWLNKPYIYLFGEEGWKLYLGSIICEWDFTIDLTNLPAKDALDALPEAVKQVVEGS